MLILKMSNFDNSNRLLKYRHFHLDIQIKMPKIIGVGSMENFITILDYIQIKRSKAFGDVVYKIK